MHLYGSRHPMGVKTYNITVRNIYPARQYAVALDGEINHLVLYAIECAPGTKMLLDRRTAAN